MSTLVDLGLKFKSRNTNIKPEGITVHYGGNSPWGNVDRSTPAKFAAATNHARCPSIVRAWHDYHLSKGWVGLGYNSAVCPHGTRYEGRGAGARSAGQGTTAGNTRSYAVVYIAGGSDPVTEGAKAAFHDEANRLKVPLRWGHSDWKATACPGSPLKGWKAAGWIGGTSPVPTPAPAPAPSPQPPTGDEEDEMARGWLPAGAERFIPVVARGVGETVLFTDFGSAKVRVAAGRGGPGDADTMWTVNTVDVPHGRHVRIPFPSYPIHGVTLVNVGDRGVGYEIR